MNTKHVEKTTRILWNVLALLKWKYNLKTNRNHIELLSDLIRKVDYDINTYIIELEVERGIEELEFDISKSIKWDLLERYPCASIARICRCQNSPSHFGKMQARSLEATYELYLQFLNFVIESYTNDNRPVLMVNFLKNNLGLDIQSDLLNNVQAYSYS